MPSSIYLAGIGMTPLGRHLDKSVKDLTAWAVALALEDAGARPGDVQSAWFSNTRQGQMEGQNSVRGQCALLPAGFGGVPVFNVENACASSSSGLAQAFAYLAAGLADVALVVGTEKMIYPDRKEAMLAAFLGGTDVHEVDSVRRLIGQDAGDAEAGKRSFFMDLYAGIARRHMQRFGTTQRQIAAVAAKNHWHSTMNPLSQYQADMGIEEVLADKSIVHPLTRAMCAPLSDGAAAAVVATRAGLRRLRPVAAPVRVRGIGVSSAQQRDFDDFEHHTARLAARRAYEMAGMAPADIDVAEVHDASSFAEILQVENLGLCEAGAGGALAESGATRLGGRIPVNTSGGLVSKGHPIAATGLVQLHELVAQLRGRAGRRQVPGARIGVAENGGGWVGVEEAACVVTVLAAED